MPLTHSIGLEELAKYFHMPINSVAKELGVCATVLKKICRRNGIPRWPHRKIKSLDKMIKTLSAAVPKNEEDEERIKQEINTLKEKRSFLVTNPNVLLKTTKKPSANRRRKKPADEEAMTGGPQPGPLPTNWATKRQKLNNSVARRLPAFGQSPFAEGELESLVIAATSATAARDRPFAYMLTQMHTASTSTTTQKKTMPINPLPQPITALPFSPTFPQRGSSDVKSATPMTSLSAFSPPLISQKDTENSSLELPRLQLKAEPDGKDKNEEAERTQSDQETGTTSQPKLHTVEPPIFDSSLDYYPAHEPLAKIHESKAAKQTISSHRPPPASPSKNKAKSKANSSRPVRTIVFHTETPYIPSSSFASSTSTTSNTKSRQKE
ncbi:RWP-RK domain-containing protein [Balamuthia mandrillaris]